MKLSAPGMFAFVISLLLALLAVVGVFMPIPYVTAHGFWVAIIAYVVLAIGNLVNKE
jgi:hypothetical protein